MNAKYYEKLENSAVRCRLCFRRCTIAEGAAGVCGVRFNDGGALVSPWLGRFCASAVDPVEKKPFMRWQPGTFIYSLGGFGCTMNCPFCQNHAIAKPDAQYLRRFESVPFTPPESLVESAASRGLRSAAFTYNEPTLQAEYILESSPLLREAGIETALVTNGMMSDDAARDLMPLIAAANVDVKTFDEERYQKLGGSLSAVTANIETWVNGGVHVEITCLIVPGISDDADGFAAVIARIAEISPEIPLHITRYFPARNYSAPPTDISLMRSFADIARARLKHVQLGNV